ncbi:MAG TPA: hypothetical protein VEL47_07705 [Myxococcota bacterium]|nr:hypothetical protein [Myxococcota bacterium]
MRKLVVSKETFAVLLAALSFFYSFAVPADETLRLVLSAGALLDQSPAFYDSRIFAGANDGSPPFDIAHIGRAFVFGRTIIYAPEGLAALDVVTEPTDEKSGIATGFVGPSFRGFSLKDELSESAKRYLGAGVFTYNYEIRTIKQKAVYAFALSDKTKPAWPKPGDDLQEIRAVRLHDARGSEQLVVARNVGDLKDRLGLVDHVLARNVKPTAFIELGGNHGDNGIIPKEKIDALLRRKPAAVFLGSGEMASLLMPDSHISLLNGIYPFADKFHQSVHINESQVDFWSATFDEKLWPLYQRLGKAKSLSEEIVDMTAHTTDSKKALNIVRVFSEDAAMDAAKSVFVDLVLLISKDPYTPLATGETVDLARPLGYAEIAPIIRVSYLDITEVQIFSWSPFTIQRIEIKRHPITDDGPKARDVAERASPVAGPSLPDLSVLYQAKERKWRAQDFERVLGGIILGSTSADVAFFEKMSITTPISGDIPFDVAKRLLSLPGNVVAISLSGKLLKSLLKNKIFNRDLVAYGVDAKSATIGGRAINTSEKYSLALSESALLKIFGIAVRGGLGEEYAIRAPFIEPIYGNITDLYFIAGPKMVSTNDATEEVDGALKKVSSAISVSEMVRTFLLSNNPEAIRTLIDDASGRPHHVVTLDLTYLDLGLSKNVTNSLYEGYVENKVLPMGRGKVPPWAHVFIFAKTELNYDAPDLITSLTGEIKYMHTNFQEKPEKDKTKLGLKFRLPWERSFFKDSSIVLSPIMENLYETKLAPHFFSNHEKLPIRTQRTESLLGFNVDFTKLGFNMDFGGAMVVDYTRTNTVNALDFGPALNFFSKWSLVGPLELSSKITSYYLFPLPNNSASKKLAFGVEGTVWLRLMRFYDFSVSAMSDFLIVTLQETPKDFAVSSIFGLTISYGRLFRLFG